MPIAKRHRQQPLAQKPPPLPTTTTTTTTTTAKTTTTTLSLAPNSITKHLRLPKSPKDIQDGTPKSPNELAYLFYAEWIVYKSNCPLNTVDTDGRSPVDKDPRWMDIEPAYTRVFRPAINHVFMKVDKPSSLPECPFHFVPEGSYWLCDARA